MIATAIHSNPKLFFEFDNLTINTPIFDIE